MNNRQIYNLFSYAGMMLLSNELIMTSPDYLEEKTLLFIGKMGKDEFIKYRLDCSNEKSGILHRYQYRLDCSNEKSGILHRYHTTSDFWNEYCNIWGVDKNNYRLMNVINYLFSVNFDKQSSFFDNFGIYFGSMDSISCEDLRYKVHFVLLEYLDDKIGGSRYLKLKSLE